MKNKIAGTVAAGIAALLIPAVSVQAVTVNFGTAAAVSSDSIQGWPKGPDTVSETAVLIDADTGAVLYDKGKDEYRYPASTTKIMTVLTAIENSSPEDSVTFTETGVRDVTWDSSNIGMKLGETITMKDCWYAAIIKSANEVCAQMAEYVGGTEAQFIEMMNEKARELGCRNTHFANASGLPDSNHYTTAYDLAKIMRAGLQNPRFRKVISAANYTIPATNLSEARGMHTHMPLMAKESNLYYEGCIGGKTGNTNDAGHTLVVAAERNGRTYIAVTMRTADLGANCTDSIALFNYAFDNFDTLTVNGKKMTVPKGVTADQLTVEQVDKNGTMLNRYFYNGQYVGYAAPAATPTPQAVQTAAAGTGENTSGTQTVQEEAEIPESETEEGLSDMSKILLGLMCAQMAEYVGGTEAQFIEMMNEKARELGCRNTHFANASGLPDSNHYTTAYDLAKIMRAGLQNPRFRKVISAANYTIPATNLSEARGMHTHMPLMAKESNLYYEGCIGGKTGNTNDAGHTLVVAAERNGRTYIAVTMRTADLGANCTDSIALFNYAFDNFDTLTVNGKKMTVPKGVTADQLTVEQVDKNGTMLNRYFYNGQYVGYAAPAATPTPQAVQTAAAGTGENTSGTQTVQEEAEIPESETEEGLSDMSKILLGLMAVMAVTLVALMTALYFKEKKMYGSRK